MQWLCNFFGAKWRRCQNIIFSWFMRNWWWWFLFLCQSTQALPFHRKLLLLLTNWIFGIYMCAMGEWITEQMSYRLTCMWLFFGCNIPNGQIVNFVLLRFSFTSIYNTFSLVFSLPLLICCYYFPFFASPVWPGHWMSAWIYQINGQAIHHSFFCHSKDKTAAEWRKKHKIDRNIFLQW